MNDYYVRYEMDRLRQEFRNTKLNNKEIFDVLIGILVDKSYDIDEELDKVREAENSNPKSVDIQNHHVRLFKIRDAIHDIENLLQDASEYASGKNKSHDDIRYEMKFNYREDVKNGLIPDDNDEDDWHWDLPED